MNLIQILKKSNSDLEKSAAGHGIITPNQRVPPILEGSRLRKGSLGDYLSGLGGMGGMGGGVNEEVQRLTKKLQEIKFPEEAKKIVD